ncbi:MAG: hypothetical protein FD127_556 [Acidimicrobiaceae bacterium]|nr:MAG: hypothetical protein FD127_556 [Acidimicrobiaceae bacterium]
MPWFGLRSSTACIARWMWSSIPLRRHQLASEVLALKPAVRKSCMMIGMSRCLANSARSYMSSTVGAVTFR